MKSNPRFLKVSHVIRLHREGLDRWGGQDGIGSQPLLESAVAMPQQTWGGEFLHTDIFHMAAAYAFHIAENQPFIDGNKRAGAASALVFLEINGISYSSRADEQLYDALIRASEPGMGKEGIADLLRGLAIPM